MLRKRTESKEKEKDNVDENININPKFFVPLHPLIVIVLVYGLYLTFCSALCPENMTVLPLWAPLAPQASYLGTHFPVLMQMHSCICTGGPCSRGFLFCSPDKEVQDEPIHH